MVKALYIRMNINAALKTELEDLADEENRTLSNFIETELMKIVSASKGSNKSLMPPRQERAAFLSMSMDAKLKAKLHKLADEDYRGLTDFTEALLAEIVATHKATHKGHKAANAREPKCDSLPLRRQARASRFATNINAQLKARLQELAKEHSRTLSDFVEIELSKIVDARSGKRRCPMPRRQVRAAGFSMRVNERFKDALQTLANERYRTLTDFIEIELHRVVTARKAK